jgi:hypothetical protein
MEDQACHAETPEEGGRVRFGWAAWLLGCGVAWRPQSPTVFDLRPPEGWTVTRNTRLGPNRSLVLVAPDGQASIAVNWVRDGALGAVPLDLVVEARALAMLRPWGVENTIARLDRIEVAGREAWAATGTSSWHAARGEFSLVGLRVRDHVTFLLLQAPAGGLETAVPAWSQVLSTLVFPHDPPPEHAVLYTPETP